MDDTWHESQCWTSKLATASSATYDKTSSLRDSSRWTQHPTIGVPSTASGNTNPKKTFPGLGSWMTRLSSVLPQTSLASGPRPAHCNHAALETKKRGVGTAAEPLDSFDEFCSRGRMRGMLEGSASRCHKNFSVGYLRTCSLTMLPRWFEEQEPLACCQARADTR